MSEKKKTIKSKIFKILVTIWRNGLNKFEVNSNNLTSNYYIILCNYIGFAQIFSSRFKHFKCLHKNLNILQSLKMIQSFRFHYDRWMEYLVRISGFQIIYIKMNVINVCLVLKMSGHTEMKDNEQITDFLNISNNKTYKYKIFV